MWRVEGEISLPEKLRFRFSIQETGHGTAKVFEILGRWWKLRGNWGQTRWAPTSLTLMQAFGRSFVVGKHTPEKNTHTHNVTILLTEDILNHFGKRFIYPMIRTVFFSRISPGVQTPSTIPFYYSMLLKSWMILRNSTYLLPEFVVFFIFIFFSGTILNFWTSQGFLMISLVVTLDLHIPMGFCLAFACSLELRWFLGGKTPWLINFFFKKIHRIDPPKKADMTKAKVEFWTI